MKTRTPRDGGDTSLISWKGQVGYRCLVKSARAITKSLIHVCVDVPVRVLIYHQAGINYDMILTAAKRPVAYFMIAWTQGMMTVDFRRLV